MYFVLTVLYLSSNDTMILVDSSGLLEFLRNIPSEHFVRKWRQFSSSAHCCRIYHLYYWQRPFLSEFFFFVRLLNNSSGSSRIDEGMEIKKKKREKKEKDIIKYKANKLCCYIRRTHLILHISIEKIATTVFLSVYVHKCMHTAWRFSYDLWHFKNIKSISVHMRVFLFSFAWDDSALGGKWNWMTQENIEKLAFFIQRIFFFFFVSIKLLEKMEQFVQGVCT